MGLLKKTNISIFDVQETNTHGGSIRVFLKKRNSITANEKTKVQKIINKEKKIGITSIKFYKKFRKDLQNLISSQITFFKKK